MSRAPRRLPGARAAGRSLPDPDAQLIDGLRKQIGELRGEIGEVAALQARIEELERELAEVEERMGPVAVPRPDKTVEAAETKN